MAEMNDSPCSSDHDEYLDPLEIADSAGARLQYSRESWYLPAKRGAN